MSLLTSSKCFPCVSDLPIRNHLTCEQIIVAGCSFFNMTFKELCSKDRHHKVVDPRQMIMAILCEQTNLTLKQIGLKLGGRDHTTVIHSKQAVYDRVDTNQDYRNTFFELKSFIMRNT